MDEWFTNVAAIENPGRNDLSLFVSEVMRFLNHVLTTQNASPIWNQDPILKELATRAFYSDVEIAAARLREAIQNTPQMALADHGLIGASARFKYNVMATVGRGWGTLTRHFTIKGGFGKIVDAIDALLDSLVAATGAGGAVKEFKDAIRALAPEE